MTDSLLLLPRSTYRGSCHCGLIKYLITAKLPAPAVSALSLSSADRESALAGLSIYKCNCSTCHKTATFHLRFADAPSDFAILAPLHPVKEDGSGDGSGGLVMEERGSETPGVRAYTCFSKTQKWYFCGTCGVRTFCIKGEMEMATARFARHLVREYGPDGKLVAGEEKSGNEDDGEEVEVPVYRPVREGWSEPHKTYLSVNMATLDPRQDGLDLRKLHENGWVGYCDYLDETGEAARTPFEGGVY